MGQRRKGRELGLKLAYQIDLHGISIEDLDSTLKEIDNTAEKVRRFAEYLVRGAWQRLDRIDQVIARLAENWQPGRMAAIDRNILRLASFELLFADDIPPKATINEWIEVAKKYSTENSGAFINGILDRLNKERSNGKIIEFSDEKKSYSRRAK